MAITTQEAFGKEELVLTQDAFGNGKKQSKTGQRILELTGLGAVGAVGAGIYKGIEKNKAVNEARQPLKNMQQQLGIEGTGFDMIPKKLSSMEEITQRGQRQLTDVDTQTQQKLLSFQMAQDGVKNSVGMMKNQLKNFDDTFLKTNVEDLAKTIKVSYPEFFKGASSAYGIGLQNIEVHFEKLGGVINTKNFSQDVLRKTIEQARLRGISEDSLKSLIQLEENMAGPQNIGKGAVMAGKPPEISFTQAKGTVSSLISDDPNGGVSGMLRENWGSFLEKNSSGEIKNELVKLNNQYSRFAQAREKLFKLSNPATGEFDREGFTKYLLGYAEDRIDDGIKDLMDILGNGNDLIKPMEGVKGQSKQFMDLVEQRFGLKQTVSKMEEQQGVIGEQINQTKLGGIKTRQELEKVINEKLDNINNLKFKYNELASRLNVAEENLNKGNMVKSLLKLMGKGSKALPFLSITPLIFQAKDFEKDPEGVLGQILGMKLAPKGSKERDIQTGKLI